MHVKPLTSEKFLYLLTLCKFGILMDSMYEHKGGGITMATRIGSEFNICQLQPQTSYTNKYAKSK